MGRLDLRLRLYGSAVLDHLRRAELRGLIRHTASRVYSDDTSVVVRKHPLEERDPAKAADHARVRPASREEVFTLVATARAQGLEAQELWDRRLLRHFAGTLGVDGCYVADGADAGPAFMQYLFTADDNDRLRDYFQGAYPLLGADEALLEHLYVAPEARSPGFVVECISQVADEARRRGASTAISLIEPSNKGALFVNHLAGFRAHGVRRCKRRLSRRTYEFEPWPAGSPTSLMDLASGRTEIS